MLGCVNMYERPTVDELARAMGLTRSHLVEYSTDKESGRVVIRHVIIEQIERISVAMFRLKTLPTALRTSVVNWPNL